MKKNSIHSQKGSFIRVLALAAACFVSLAMTAQNKFVIAATSGGGGGGGTVLTVNGTTNRITSTGGANPTLDIGSDVVDKNTAQTLTNKTIAFGSNTVSGTKAQFNTAITDADMATLDGNETLTNKSIDASQLTGNVSKSRLSLAKIARPFTIQYPTASQNIGLLFTTEAITIDNVKGVMTGTSQSITLVVNYGSSRASADGTIVASNTFDSGDAGYQTTGFSFTLNTTSIPANSFIWFTTSATSGTITDLNITITYHYT